MYALAAAFNILYAVYAAGYIVLAVLCRNAGFVRWPRLIAACPETDVLGASFYLMEPVVGFNATTDPIRSPSDRATRSW